MIRAPHALAPRFAALVLAALAGTGCGSAVTSGSPAGPATGGRSSLPAAASPAVTTTVRGSGVASAAASRAPSGATAVPPSSVPAGQSPAGSFVTPTAAPTAGTPGGSPGGASTPPASPSPDGGGTGPAAGCSGSAENRDFLAAAAQAVQWPVYCAVLPTGWFIDSGSWRLKNGGQMQVSYRGPGGARLVLQEGSYCTSGVSACTPRDHELGTAAFGDRQGTLVDLGPSQPADGYAIYVNPGTSPPSWSLTATGLDQAAFVAVAGAMLRVAP